MKDYIALGLFLGIVVIELKWSPRIEITREKDVFLFYTRKYERIPFYLFTL